MKYYLYPKNLKSKANMKGREYNAIIANRMFEQGVPTKILTPKNKDWNEDITKGTEELEESIEESDEEKEEGELCQGLVC